jgi:hypothetical protein
MTILPLWALPIFLICFYFLPLLVMTLRRRSLGGATITSLESASSDFFVGPNTAADVACSAAELLSTSSAVAALDPSSSSPAATSSARSSAQARGSRVGASAPPWLRELEGAAWSGTRRTGARPRDQGRRRRTIVFSPIPFWVAWARGRDEAGGFGRRRWRGGGGGGSGSG